ncbi:hypothetical protein O181_031356 [Austropuccinia psidii MF-1]|uniref:Uncharacterized protein n=1 Tax=Austropuccinia psidii MF-1 TaxID=1389203 RepID=A0A9Q3CUQ0_9BASI|nr:hypothetical protein [Austropuccinia psidii MF-1]
MKFLRVALWLVASKDKSEWRKTCPERRAVPPLWLRADEGVHGKQTGCCHPRWLLEYPSKIAAAQDLHSLADLASQGARYSLDRINEGSQEMRSALRGNLQGFQTEELEIPAGFGVRAAQQNWMVRIEYH